MGKSKPENSWAVLNRDIVGCTRCPRLIGHCEHIAEVKRKSFSDWEYWGKPVPNLGDASARILLVGLAPAAHGANRTGRMFTGDRSGDFLFEAMHAVGLCNQPRSDHVNDALELNDCAVTAICHCAPPANKPTPAELTACRPWLEQTISLTNPTVFVALGQLAWASLVRFAADHEWEFENKVKFGHGAHCRLKDGGSPTKVSHLVGCYHPSQQNTFTGKLTQTMLRRVLRKVMRLASKSS